VVAFIFSQDIPGVTDSREHVASIDEVERKNGSDFL
jgi:hypothetical protein